MKYINYDFRKNHYHDYSTQPKIYDSGTINHIPDILKVKAAKEWMGKAGDDMHHKIVEHEVTSDWTFSSPYKGSIGVYGEFLHSCENLASPVVDNSFCQEYLLSATEEKIPVERLTPQNPIIHFEDIIFYEDELDDFGRVEVRLRFRVMEDCAFGLFRCYLRYSEVTRNDSVLIRSLDTRIFIDFDRDYVLREFTVKEGTYEEIASKGFTFTSQFNNNENQADIIQPFLATKKTVRDTVSMVRKAQ